MSGKPSPLKPQSGGNYQKMRGRAVTKNVTMAGSRFYFASFRVGLSLNLPAMVLSRAKPAVQCNKPVWEKPPNR